MQALEIRDAGVIADRHLAVDRGVGGQHVSGGDDQRIAVRPVIAASIEQPHATSAPADDQLIAIVFNFVNPLGANRRLGRERWDAGINETRSRQQHFAKIGCDRIEAKRQRGQAPRTELTKRVGIN